MNTVRQPAVAGLFYPGNPRELSSSIKSYLLAAHPPAQAMHAKAIIVPHAGYVYSGATAATAYATLASQRDTIKKVVLLGPAHRVQLRGLAIMDVDYFRTPLGDVPQDTSKNESLLALSQVRISDEAHWQEHSIEVQLPFLQTVLNDFSLTALAVGDATVKEVEEVLNLLWGDQETLIVISSDLSHYHDYKTAQYIDRSTCEAIENLNIENIGHQQACGCVAVNGLLRTAKKRSMKVDTLAMNNSADSCGDPERVVGYGSWAFTEA